MRRDAWETNEYEDEGFVVIDHHHLEAGADHNVAEDLIANPQEQCEGKYLKVSAREDGSFTVLNLRNGFSKAYSKK